MKFLLFLLLPVLAGCPNMLPMEAPDGTKLMRLSRIQGKADPLPGGISAWGDTCQLVQIGDGLPCVEMEQDGCKVNTCPAGVQ